MGANASRVKFLVDFDDTVTLRDPTDGAETSTATETAVALNELDGAYWHSEGSNVTGFIPNGIICVMFHVSAIVGNDTDETYVLSLEVDDASAMNDTPVSVWSQTISRSFTGILYAYVDSQNIRALATDSSGSELYMAAKATLGGTTPSITYGAWIVKSKMT